jgi:hypothetical protein
MKCWISGRLAVGLVLPGLLAALASAGPASAAQDPPLVPALVMPEPPSLVEIARLEEARRRVLKGKSKVYTDKDVRRGSPSQDSASPAPTPPGSTPVPDAPAPAGGQPDQTGKSEETWRKRMTNAREELRRNEAFAEALQTRVNALTTEFVGRDDPYQRAKIGEDRQKAVAELDRVKNEIELGKKTILDIEEDARKAGVPPGWIR